MKPDKTRLHELLLRSVEEVTFGYAELSLEEKQDVEIWLQNDESARKEEAAIRKHLHLLSQLPAPAVPNDLASRCLDAMQGRRSKQTLGFRKRWALAGLCTVILIFGSGIWIGHTLLQPQIPPFMQLVQVQGYLIDRLESDLAKNYQETSFTSANPWYQHMENIKITSQAITAAYEKNTGDPVIERGLSLAITQNINTLKTLCSYIENNRAIPDRDFKLIDTSQALPENRI